MKTPEEIGQIIANGLKKGVRAAHPRPFSFFEEARLLGVTLGIPKNFVSEGTPQEAQAQFENIREPLTKIIRAHLEEILDPGTTKFVKQDGEELDEGWKNRVVSLRFREITRNQIVFKLGIQLIHPEGTSQIIPQRSPAWK